MGMQQMLANWIVQQLQSHRSQGCLYSCIHSMYRAQFPVLSVHKAPLLVLWLWADRVQQSSVMTPRPAKLKFKCVECWPCKQSLGGRPWHMHSLLLSERERPAWVTFHGSRHRHYVQFRAAAQAKIT